MYGEERAIWEIEESIKARKDNNPKERRFDSSFYLDIPMIVFQSLQTRERLANPIRMETGERERE